ncbi:MAG: GGDEF domain-containing protein, partial [Lachnospiraceae bacterium]|nr:GGDEF domain-containing protein [Lachnospiraceae bacterium]
LKQERHNEISELYLNFNNMKHCLQNMLESTRESLYVANRLLEEQRKNAAMEQALETEKNQKDFWIQKADTDAFTGVLNRAAFARKMQEYCEKGSEDLSKRNFVALFMIDMDNFKGVNDTLGHLGGDAALQYLAGTLKDLFSKNGFAGRIGGDEFAGFCYNVEDLEHVEQIASKLCKIMNRKMYYQNKECTLSVSTGVVIIECKDQEINLYELADQALYAVKNCGKNHYKIVDHAFHTENETE